MKPIESIDKLSGLYVMREAAYYTRMSIGRMRYWFLGDRKHRPVRNPKIDRNGVPFITFHELLESICVTTLRPPFSTK